MADADEPEQNLAHIHWSWPEAIAANPARSLATADLAMDYFAYSPFWDSKSNNNVLRTQRRVENPTYGHAQEKHELDAFRSGFEYVVAHALPPALFVVHRRDVRADGSRARPSAAYFVLHDRIYKAPSLYDAVSTRLQNATALIGKTFAALSVAHPPSNPRAQSAWRAVPKAKAAAADSRDTADAPAAPDAPDTSGPAGDLPAPAPAPQAAAKTAQPSLHLAHALQATRAALPQLDALQRAPARAYDPATELRALEAAMLGAAGRQGGGAGSSAGPGAGLSAPALSVPAVGVKAVSVGPTPGLTPKGSVGASPYAASPLVQTWLQ
ncbi:Mediator of RNA polymerase II transcription subunit 6 [Cryptotrichosporon argae]